MIKSVYFTPRISLSEKKVTDSISRGNKCKVNYSYGFHHTICNFPYMVPTFWGHS